MKTTLIGLGNILLMDEGIGVHAANYIRERYSFSPEIEIIDGGTLGLDLLPYFEDRDNIVIADAVNFGKETGFIGVIEDDDIPSVLMAKLSVHNIGLNDVVAATKLMDRMPSKMRLVGIQILSTEVGIEMTDTLKEKFPRFVQVIIETLQELNVKCVLRSPQKLSA
ncbi:MAG: HyaD/HybD family hydrogenase maturation endopeptidase [Nitrospirae bacterium]|nr:HyaD/HybD family hydrogenase maturation endopeptidase [Nitrospirota bacterium]